MAEIRASRAVAQWKGVESSLHQRWSRLKRNFVAIVQGAIAAGLAYWVAQSLLGHPRPFFAPMAAVIILGLTPGARIKRAVELIVGCSLGVGLGDFLILMIGSGAWQISLAVFISLVVASFLSASQLLVNQVAIGSILIATIIPPGTAETTERMFDAVVGGVVGLIVMALLPQNPVRGGRREVARVLGIASSVLRDVARALPARDAEAMREALHEVRGTQGAINAMILEAKTSKEYTQISPLLWASKRHARSFTRILEPVDNVVRNTRVLARRAVVLVEDGDEISPEQIELIEELADITGELADIYLDDTISEAVAIPELSKRLRHLGARCGVEVAEGRVLSAQVILAQTRSIVVDLLQVTGMSRPSAVAALQPTSSSPAYPPEVIEEN